MATTAKTKIDDGNRSKVPVLTPPFHNDIQANELSLSVKQWRPYYGLLSLCVQHKCSISQVSRLCHITDVRNIVHSVGSRLTISEMLKALSAAELAAYRQWIATELF